MTLRGDLALISDLINPNARVLDLGCGTGALLANLQAHKSVNGYGLDKDPENIQACLDLGVNVIEQDLDDGIDNFATNNFDMVIMADALQAVREPRGLLREMLRIGEECVVTFPNFGHWRCRLQLGLGGHMPMSKHLPHYWHDTPNIHLCTTRDFERLCAEENFRIIQRRVVDTKYREHWSIAAAPNLMASHAFYRLGRPS